MKSTVIFTSRVNNWQGAYGVLDRLLKQHTINSEFIFIPNEAAELNAYAQLNKRLLKNEVDFYIIIDDYGVYPYMTLAKYEKQYVALIEDEHSAYMTRLHNNANVIVLSEQLNNLEMLQVLVDAYLNSHYESGRHKVRLDMLDHLTTKGEN